MIPGLPEEIEINGQKYPNSLNQDVLVNQGSLVHDFSDHAQKMAYWATLYELSLDQETRLKNELAKAYAHCDKQVRQEADATGVKMTEKKVENSVITHPMYTEIQEEYQQAKARTGLLKAARDAMIHRRDMLIQLGATARAEGDSDISIRGDAARDVVGANSCITKLI